jgi:hypothetical protein
MIVARHEVPGPFGPEHLLSAVCANRARSRSLTVTGMNRPIWVKRVNEVSPATSLAHTHPSKTRTIREVPTYTAKQILARRALKA